MTITPKDHRLALILLANPSMFTLTEVELRACRAVIDDWAQLRRAGAEDLRIARSLFAQVRKSLAVQKSSGFSLLELLLVLAAGAVIVLAALR